MKCRNKETNINSLPVQTFPSDDRGWEKSEIKKFHKFNEFGCDIQLTKCSRIEKK